MFRKSVLGVFVGTLAVLMVGCWSARSRWDISRYVGKTEAEIIHVLGEPSGWCERPVALQDGRKGTEEVLPPLRLLYRQETTTLPKPLTGLDFVLTEEGLCNEVDGYTNGFASPEELLAAVDLSHKVSDVLEQDDRAITYEAPSLGRIEVFQPSRFEGLFADFAIVG